MVAWSKTRYKISRATWMTLDGRRSLELVWGRLEALGQGQNNPWDIDYIGSIKRCLHVLCVRAPQPFITTNCNLFCIKIISQTKCNWYLVMVFLWKRSWMDASFEIICIHLSISFLSSSIHIFYSYQAQTLNFN